MELLLYTDRETAFRLLGEIPFREKTSLQPIAAFDKKTAERLLGRCGIALVDLDCPDGADILQLIRSCSPETPAVTFSARSSEDPFHCSSRRSSSILRMLLKALPDRPAAPDEAGREYFWRRFLSSGALSDTLLIRRNALRCGISAEERFTLLQITIFDRLQFGLVEQLPLSETLRTALIALVAAPPLQPEALVLDDAAGQYWLVLKQGRLSAGLLKKRCALFADFCRERYLFSTLCWAADCTSDDFRGTADQIRLVSRDIGTEKSCACDVRSYPLRESGYSSVGFTEKFRRILPDDGADAFIKALNELLDDFEERKVLNSRLLRMMRPDLERLLREAFAEKKLDILPQLESPACLRLLPQAHFNRNHLVRYIRAVLQPVWNSFPARKVYPEPVRRIIEYLDENLDKPYSREIIGQVIGLNPNYLAALFKEATGQSISAYRGARQMERAVKLLVDTKLPISAVAEGAGFSDSTYFCNAFRRQYGTTPGEYRRRHTP